MSGIARFEELYRIATRAGTAVSRHHDIVSREDGIQEAFRWLLDQPALIERSVDPEGHLYEQQLYFATLRYLISMAQNAHASIYGYEPDDQPYSMKSVRAVLPSVWTGEGAERHESEIRTKNDPAEGGGYLAMTLDVARALELIGLKDRKLLFLRYAMGESWDAVALTVTSSADGVRVRVNRSVQVMVDYLNGLDRRLYPYEPVGKRRVISNATANYRTASAWDGE